MAKLFQKVEGLHSLATSIRGTFRKTVESIYESKSTNTKIMNFWGLPPFTLPMIWHVHSQDITQFVLFFEALPWWYYDLSLTICKLLHWYTIYTINYNYLVLDQLNFRLARICLLHLVLGICTHTAYIMLFQTGQLLGAWAVCLDVQPRYINGRKGIIGQTRDFDLRHYNDVGIYFQYLMSGDFWFL